MARQPTDSELGQVARTRYRATRQGLSPATRDGIKETRSGSLHNPAKAVVELSQKARRLLACDTITKLDEDSI
jgi:hypothetical protein